ncbi:MAG TPA: DoxX family protein [Hyphomicrobiaceae bacterium]|nr:DoxX family protein [Hyphomicrobiaceae bacterium]
MERVNDAALLVGRLMMAALFLSAGIPKAIGFASGGFAQGLGNMGVPFPEIVAPIAIAVEVLAPVALVLGIFPRISALLLIAFTIVATALAHKFWVYPLEQQQAQMGQFFKNVAIIGGLLCYFVSGAGAWSFAGRRVTIVGTPEPAKA